ncbi:MAG: DUF3098 domain-containing protein [Bacteroidaceae bacterium]|nr:DUF3098 domain-containing protein [Bacteroidaceae bacterium]
MNKRFTFEKINYILMAAAVVVIILGFVLMTGASSTETAFDPAIFNARRIKVAPIICFVGFVFMIFAIMYHPKKKEEHELD